MATAAVGLVQFRRQQVGPDSRERLSGHGRQVLPLGDVSGSAIRCSSARWGLCFLLDVFRLGS